MIVWPDVFPAVMRENYQLKRGNNLLTTDMQSGLSRTRRVFENVPTSVTASFITTSAEGMAFEMWYKSALKDGTEWFEMPLAEPHSSSNSAVKTTYYRARFTEKYSGPELIGVAAWKYTMQLIALPIPDTVDPDYGNWPEYVIDANIFDVAMNRYWPEA